LVAGNPVERAPVGAGELLALKIAEMYASNWPIDTTMEVDVEGLLLCVTPQKTPLKVNAIP